MLRLDQRQLELGIQVITNNLDLNGSKKWSKRIRMNKNVINSRRKLSTSITRILLIYEEERMIRNMIRDTILISMEQILIPLIKGSLLDFSPWTVPDTSVHVLLGVPLLSFSVCFIITLSDEAAHISINKLPAGTFARVRSSIGSFFEY